MQKNFPNVSKSPKMTENDQNHQTAKTPNFGFHGFPDFGVPQKPGFHDFTTFLTKSDSEPEMKVPFFGP